MRKRDQQRFKKILTDMRDQLRRQREARAGGRHPPRPRRLPGRDRHRLVRGEPRVHRAACASASAGSSRRSSIGAPEDRARRLRRVRDVREEIGLKRLEARPVAELCIDCKAEQEKLERGHGRMTVPRARARHRDLLRRDRGRRARGRRALAASVVRGQDALHAPVRRRRARARVARPPAARSTPVVAARARRGGRLARRARRGVAVTAGPGLLGSLLVGLSLRARRSPIAPASRASACTTWPGTSPRPSSPTPALAPPYLGLVVSGGHTALYRDRGGRAGRRCSARRATTRSARPSTRSRSCSGSRSRAGPRSRGWRSRATSARSRCRARSPARAGLRLLVQRAQDRGRASSCAARRARRARRRATRADLAASFQAAATDPLVAARAAGARATKGSRASPSSAASRRTARLRREMRARGARRDGFARSFPPPALCTDNAAMVAAAGARLLARGERHGLDLTAFSRVPLAERPVRREPGGVAVAARGGVRAVLERHGLAAAARTAGRTSSPTSASPRSS